MNCTGLDLSSPKLWRICSTSSGDGWRPARSSAGSADGSTLKMMNVISVIMNSRKTTQTSRRAMYAAMISSLPSCALGVQGVLHAVADEVEGEHGQQQGHTREEHVPPRGVEFRRRFGEHRPPRRVALHAHAEERQCRLEQDVR